MTVYPLVAFYECGAMYGYVEWLPWHVNGYCRLKCDPALGILKDEVVRRAYGAGASAPVVAEQEASGLFVPPATKDD